MSESTRVINRELFINADPAVVFEAFAEAEHIMRWFAPYARSEPGVGGFINLNWNEESFSKDCEIVEWEPGRRLVMNWYAGPDGETCLPVELVLQNKDGGTLLHLTHSGFLSDASWDDEYDSHGRGWSYELRSLKYYVERQFGLARHFVMRRLPVSGDLVSAWSSIVGTDGLFAGGSAGLAEGDSFRLRLPNGEVTVAELMLQSANKDFAVIAEILDGGLFRFALETFAGQPEIWVWAFSWHLAERELETLVSPWFDALGERLAGLKQSA